MQNLFSLLILVLLVQTSRSDWDYVTEQGEIAPTSHLKRNFNESQNMTVITTTATTLDDEKFDDYELKRLFVQNFKLYTYSEKTENKSEPTISPRRKARAVANITGPFYGMECLSCYANGMSGNDARCYQGVDIPVKRCSDAEYCFTEIHPLFLKRGCILPGRVNRTFVCNCPLCNDKPIGESSHFEYTRLSDWAYDNLRLTRPMHAMQLPCKICETKGSDVILDNNCRSGKNTNYMVCGVNQICYTNVDDETDFVSRGCINSGVYNSIHYFCNNSMCNNVRFMNPKLRMSLEEIPVKGNPSHLRKALQLTDVDLLQMQISCSTKRTINLSFIMLITFLQGVFIIQMNRN